MKIVNGRENFGNFLEDFEEGMLFLHWPAKTITEYDCHLFSLLTMNQHPLHIDQEYSRETQHKKILVVGTYVFSLVVGQTVRDISGKAIANLSYESIVHHEPVFINDTIRSESRVISTRQSKSKSGRGIVYVETSAFNQSNEMVLSFKRNVLVPCRDA